MNWREDDARDRELLDASGLNTRRWIQRVGFVLGVAGIVLYFMYL